MLERLSRVVYGALDGVRRRPLLAWLLLTCALSWGAWISLAGGGSLVLPGRLPSDIPGMLVPALTAFAVTALAGGEASLRELALRVVRFPWRSPWPWLLGPSPVAALLLVLAMLALAGRPVPPLRAFFTYPGLPSLPPDQVYSLVLVGVGFGQEIGWRGFLLPRLQARLGPLGGAVAVAVPWGAWLAPLLLANRAPLGPGGQDATSLAAAALLLLASSILLAFVVARTDGGLAAAATWHACLRMATATEAARGVVGLAVTSLAVIAALGVLFAELAARRRGTTLLAPPAAPPPRPVDS